MSEWNALARKLATLVATDDMFEAGARTISIGGSPAPMTAILNEIDDTVLERALEIVADDNTVTLVVSGRRLRGILSVSPADMDTASATGHALARDEPDVLNAALALVEQLCGSAKRITVRSTPAVPFGKGGDRGISADALAEIWQVQMREVPEPPMRRFLSSNAAAISAMMHINDGDIIATSGDFDALQTIWNTQLHTFRKAHRKFQSGEDGPQLICFEGALGDGTAAAFAVAGDDVVLLAYRPDHLGAMLASWRAITS